MSDNPLSGKVGLDVTQFRKAIADMGRQLRVVKSEWESNAAAMGKWTDDVGGVESRLGALNKAIPLHESKVAALRERYEQLAAEQGANSSAAQNMLVNLNKATGELNSAQREAGELEDRLTDLKNAQDDTADKSVSLKGKLGGLVSGVKSLAGGLLTAARAAAPLIGKLKDIGAAAVRATARLISATAAAAKTIAVNMAKIGAALVVGMGVLLATTIKPASDLNETLSKTKIVFGEAAASVLAFGAESAKSLGMSQNAALGAAATFGNLLRATGLTEEQSTEMSMSLVQLAADLASFNNIDPTEALEKLRAGLTGEAEPLKALGVNMNEARIQSKALEMGLIEQGEALTAAAKAQAAYAIIVEDTSLAQGDFARTSEGLANQQRIFGGNLENLKAKIGTGLLPIATALVSKFNEFFASDTVSGVIDSIVESLGSLGAGIAGLLDGTVSLDTVGALFGNLFGGIGEAISGGLGDFDLGALLGSLLSGIGSLATKLNLGSLALDIITGLVDSITTGLPGLIEAAQAIIAKLIEFITTGLPALIEAAIPLVLAIIEGIVTALPLIIGAAGEILIALVNGIIAAIPVLIPAAIAAILTLAQTLIRSLPLLIDAAMQIIMALVTGLVTMLPTLIPVAVEAILSIVTTLVENLPLLIDAAVQIVLALVNGLVTMLPTLIPVAVEALVSIVNALITNLPLLVDAALQLIMALADGLIAALPVLIEAIPPLITALIDAIIVAFPQIILVAGELILALATGLIDAIPVIIEALGLILVALYEALGGDAAIENIKTIGVNIVEGIWKGIKSAQDWFYAQISSFFTNLIKQAKEALGIDSPSRVFAEMIGQNIPAGILQGIRQGMPGLERYLAGAMGGLAIGSGLALSGNGMAASKTEINISMPLTVYGADDINQVRSAANDGILKALRAAGVR